MCSYLEFYIGCGHLVKSRREKAPFLSRLKAGVPWREVYGYGVWIDQPGQIDKRFWVEGSDPGVAMRSTVYPAEGVILTAIGNTGRALWPLYRDLEELLGL